MGEVHRNFCKAFGNSKIAWKIENFSLLTDIEGYHVDSAEFGVNGPEITRWKFTFVVKRKDTSCMVLFLERLDDSGPAMVYVNWSLVIEAQNEKCYYSEYNHEFKVGLKKRVDVYSVSDVLSTLQSFNNDTVTMYFHLIVHHRDKTTKMNPPRMGMRSLSEDLGSMFRSAQVKRSDKVTFKIENKSILAHKAIVCRNDYLKERVAKVAAAADGVIELPEFNCTAARRFIEFLYTGNLEKILQNPTLGMYKCLEAMDKDLLRCYYSPEELSMNTKVIADELEHLWLIPNFSSRKEERIISGPFKKSNMDVTWQVRLYPNVDGSIYDLSVDAVVVEGERPLHACLEFGLEDVEGEVHYPQKVFSSDKERNMKIKDFVKKACVPKIIATTKDTLNLIFRVRTWGGKHESKIGSRKYSFVSNIKESSYEKLSSNMLALFKSEDYSDVCIKAGGDTFKAHRCIVSARSSYFSRQLKDAKEIEEKMSSKVLGTLLQYIYSGVLPDMENDLDELRQAAEDCDIETLVQECKARIEKRKPRLSKTDSEKSTTEVAEKDESMSQTPVEA